LTRSILRGRIGTWRRGPRGDLRDFYPQITTLQVIIISHQPSIQLGEEFRGQTLDNLGTKQNTLVTGAFGAGVLEQ